MVQPTAFWNHCLPISVLVKAAVVGRMPARITSMPLRTTMRTIWTREAIRPDQSQDDQDEHPDPGLVVIDQDGSSHSAKPLPSVDRSMMAAENASAAITRMEMTPRPRPGHQSQREQGPEQVLQRCPALFPDHPDAAENDRENRQRQRPVAQFAS